MKRILFSLLTAATLFLAGCLEITQEITINEDGSGTFTVTNDLSALIGMAKQMGGDKPMEGADRAIDSTISMADAVDSIPDLTEEEKAIVRKGTLHINADMASEKFLTNLSFPFRSPEELGKVSALSGKVMSETMKETTGAAMPMGEEAGAPKPSSIEDYFDLQFSNGLLIKSLNKDKYANAAADEYLSGMKQSAAMGLEFKTTYVFNLPRPAKTAEGKGITLSEDRKKITIVASLDDFFDEPAKLEYKIEY
ncbi:MAG: hypothetical protein J0M10_00765 [Chitinophagales bacterium]|nr:hypothetical protein [Chitinophagales bacterium]